MAMPGPEYPDNWPAISEWVRWGRANGRCEWCGAAHGTIHPATGEYVQLSTHHLGVAREDGSPGDRHDKRDCRPENLAALCQECHRAADARAAVIEAGQLELPGL